MSPHAECDVVSPELGASASAILERTTIRRTVVNFRHEAKRAGKRRGRAAAGLSAWTLLTLSAAVSGAQDSGMSDWERPNSSCDPACRSGYECRRGECTPICSPACPEGFLCSADGGCVSTQPAAPTRPVRPARLLEPRNSCEPACRSGYTCRETRCVSLCNPACPADEICTAEGECISAQLAAHSEAKSEPEPEAPPAPARDTSADSLVNLHADAAGLLQFGLTPTLEIGETFSGFLRLRVMNTGLASYFLLGRDSDDELRLGVGAALGVHWFTAKRGNMRGFYGGAALEYAYVETRDDSDDFARYQTHALIPQIDLGYRWAFGELLFGLSAKLGLAIPFQNRASGIGDTPCRRPDSCREDLSVAFIPGIGVDLGWFIPR